MLGAWPPAFSTRTSPRNPTEAATAAAIKILPAFMTSILREMWQLETKPLAAIMSEPDMRARTNLRQNLDQVITVFFK
jgi:hypothetical protein